MKLAALLTSLKAFDATKGLAADIEKDLGHLPDVDTKDLAGAAVNATAATERATKAEKNNQELMALVKDLEPKAKGAEALQTRVTAFETEKRENVLGKAFSDAAKAAGIPDAAVSTARRLADLSKVQVDLDKGTVTGLTKDLFDGLKKDHPVLAAPAAPPPPPPPPGAVPPLPPAGTDAPAFTAAAAVKDIKLARQWEQSDPTGYAAAMKDYLSPAAVKERAQAQHKS